MLQTTVNYLSLLETKRHNVKTEAQTDTQLSINQQEANIHAGQLEETKRHNLVTESISWGNLAELQRHNVVTEGINQFDANTRRQQLDINRYEADTHRYAAIQNAGIGWANVAVNQGQLAVSQQRAENDFEIGTRNAAANIKQATTAALKQQEEVRYHDLSLEQDRRRIEVSEQQNVIRQQELEWSKNIDQQRANIQKADLIWSNLIKSSGEVRQWYESLVGG